MSRLEAAPVVIVGAGHAGLALSRELTHAGIDHLVIERGRIGQSWRTRWDSFCLVTPNWTVQLPGGAYDGEDRDGFMPRDELVAHLERYARGFGAPVREGVDVFSVEPEPGGGFLLRSSDGDIHARNVVLATGGYQKPYRPPGAAQLPPGVFAIDAEGYSNPAALPSGKVLVVGSGQTGCQIAEELQEAGRDVVLACGRAPWAPRRVEGRDIVAWVSQTPFLDQSIDDLANPIARLGANLQATGRDGGHDLHFRTLHRRGVTLTGRFLGVDGESVLFASDLADAVAFGDARYREMADLVRKTSLDRGERPPEFPPPEPFDATGLERMQLRGLGAVIFTSGFRPDYTTWVHFPSAFDEWGFPVQRDGASTVVPGLFFIGTHFLRKRKSATLFGIADDAPAVAARIIDAVSRAPGLEQRLPDPLS